MELNCTFDIYTFPHGECYYRCRITNQKIPENIKLTIKGQHLEWRTNDDVTHVKFEDCSISKVPQGLTNIFPNMRSLSFQKSKLKKLENRDLIEYKNIEKFICIWNDATLTTYPRIYLTDLKT